MFDSILIAVDGSECSKRAARTGFDLAAACDARVDLLMAIDPGGSGGREDLRAAATDVLDDFVELAGDLDPRTTVVDGRAHDAILEHAGDEGVDLVVMGREGRSGLSERLLGSTTERVLRRATVPTLIVPGRGDDPGEFRDVLVTTDGSDVAAVAGPLAANVAGLHDGTLHMLSVVDVQASAGLFDAGGVSTDYVERLEDQARGYLDGLEERIGDVDVERTSTVRRGVAHEEIAAYVEENGVDLVVMSSVGQSNIGGQHLGSTTGRVLRTVGVPVLVATPTDD